MVTAGEGDACSVFRKTNCGYICILILVYPCDLDGAYLLPDNSGLIKGYFG